jgi:hypothetical protein
MLRSRHAIGSDARIATHSHGLTTYQQSVERLLMDAKGVVCGNGICLNVKEPERNLQLACYQSGSSLLMDNGIALWSELLDQFDLLKIRIGVH